MFDRSNNTGAIGVKMDASVLEERSSFKVLWFTFSSKLDWGSYIISIAKTDSKLAELVPIPYSRGRSTRYSNRLYGYSVTIPRCYKDVNINSFFPRTTWLWNSLPIECFPLAYDLNGFKSRINRHLLTVGSF